MSSSLGSHNQNSAAPSYTLEQAPVEAGHQYPTAASDTLELTPEATTDSTDVAAPAEPEAISIRPATLDDLVDIYIRCGAQFVTYAERKVGADHAADLFHTVITKLCSELDDRKLRTDALMPVIYRWLSNAAIDHMRVKGNNVLPLSSLLAPDHDDTSRKMCESSFLIDGQNVAAEATFNVDFERALEQISPVYAESLQLYMDGYSAEEIAAILNTPANTISKRLTRGRESLVAGMPGYNMDLKRRPKRTKQPSGNN